MSIDAKNETAPEGAASHALPRPAEPSPARPRLTWPRLTWPRNWQSTPACASLHRDKVTPLQ